MSFCRNRLAVALTFATLSPNYACAAEELASANVAQANAVEGISGPTQDIAGETLAAIQRVREQASESEAIPAEVKAEITEICDKAVAKLADADALAATTAKLQQELEQAASTLETLQAQTEVDEPEPLPALGVGVDEMRGVLSAADQRVSAAREKLQNVQAEIERRAERRKVLPELLTQCREQLAAALETPKPLSTDQRPLLAEAQHLYLLARREFCKNELPSLEQESRTYEATSRLWLARRDAAEKTLQAASERHKAIVALAARAQRQDAQRQAAEARRRAIDAHPAIKEAAAKNAALALHNQKLVTRTQKVQRLLTEARDLAEDMRVRLEDVTKRAEAAKYSPAIGVMLRSQQDQLPPLSTFQRRLQNRPAEISRLYLDICEWESERRDVLQIDKAVESARQEIESTGAIALREEVAEELRRVLEARAKILAELYSNADECVGRLAELDAAETEVIAKTEVLASFIAEHVLWVRSAPSLSLDELQQAISSWQGWQVSLKRAEEVSATLLHDFRQRPLRWSMAMVMLAVLVVGRSRARNQLMTSGAAAVKPTATLFRSTVDASLATLVLAAPIPVMLGFIGWRLCRATASLPYASGWALVLFASVYAMLNLVRYASISGGLGTHHFGWDPKGLSAIRRAARSLQLFALPLLALAGGIEAVDGESMLSTIGRLSLISALLVIGAVCYRLFRATGPLATSLAASAKGWVSGRTLKLLIPCSMLAVTGLIAASAAGYHYTAMQLTRRVFVSCVFVFACLALRSLLMRWLLVAYRRVAMKQAREKRQTRQEAQECISTESQVINTQPQVSLSNINQQARKLVGAGAALAFVASMLFIWGDVLPALGIFSRVDLWASGLVPLDPDAGTTFITLTDLIIAAAIFALTWFAGCNLPGLLEIAVLQKLPLDAGARYAASSVTRYMIIVAGTALCMRQLGVGWQSVQWLVAAMTVGLGFGLQEIFANFVSGIILLFERPARVGDTVTIGEITGTITKIRIRATTILDWNNKELIVPNKDFVTGNLVNWTLTNANLRLVVKVGVAYGTDTRLTTELLYQVARDNPSVLDNPEPFVVFEEFGASSLNFELRLFVSDLNLYRRLRHDLHLAIDDLFRQHQVEIAFPQCDLHIKTMPTVGQEAVKMPAVETPAAQQAAA